MTSNYKRYREFTCVECGEKFTVDYGDVPISVLEVAYLINVDKCDKCIAKVDNQRQNDVKKARINEKLIKSTIPPERYDTLFNDDHGNLKLKSFIWGNRYKSQFIADINNTNKTWCMCASMSAAIRMELFNTVEYWNFNDACNTYSRMCGKNYDAAEKFKHHFYYVDLLGIDDFAKRSIKATAGEFFYDVIDKRYVKNKITWITSNFGGQKLIEKFEDESMGQAVVSRIRRMRDNGDLMEYKK